METITRGLTYTKTITMVTEICCNCGIAFGIPSDFKEECVRHGNAKTFYCPNGHGQSYTKSEAQKLKEQHEIEMRRKEQEVTDLYERLVAEEKEKKKLNKMIKRVHNGVCPCCNRTFQNLMAHMKHKHPELLKEQP